MAIVVELPVKGSSRHETGVTREGVGKEIGLAVPGKEIEIARKAIEDNPYEVDNLVTVIGAALACKLEDATKWPEVSDAMGRAVREAVDCGVDDRAMIEGRDESEAEERHERLMSALKASWDGTCQALERVRRERETERLRKERAEQARRDEAVALGKAAAKLAQVHDGVSALEYATHKDTDPKNPEHEAVFLDKMNAEHAVVSVGGSVRYLHRSVDKSGRAELRFMTAESMAARYAVISFPRINSTSRISGFELWNRWPGRLTYDGVGFFPGSPKNPPKVPRGYFNLWNGFAVEPRPGDWSGLKSHLKNCVCGGDQAKFDWLMDWLADAVQNPQNKPGTALVLKSRTEGTGKTMLARALRAIFGPHWAKASSANHVLGNFNANLETCVVLSVEEAIWAGSKQAESVLKDLITAEELRIERKGADAYVADNCTRIIFTSNEDWVIPAGPESRRYCVLEVVNERAKDPSYFGPIFAQLENGGYEAMLHELLGREIKSNLREAPVTEGLIEQRERSLDGVDRFLLDFARDGFVRSAETGEAYELDDKKPTEVDLVTMAHAAAEQCDRWDARGVQTILAKRLRSLGAESMGRKRLKSGGQATVYQVPSKGAFLAAVLKRLGLAAEPLAKVTGYITRGGFGEAVDEPQEGAVVVYDVPPNPILH